MDPRVMRAGPAQGLEPEPDTEPQALDERRDANGLIGTGLGIGAFGAATAAAFGAVCPVCVVATPLLVGAGVWKRIRLAQRERKAEG